MIYVHSQWKKTYHRQMRKVDYLTYGRDVEFGVNIFTQSLPVLISLLVGSVPILLLPMPELYRSLLFVAISIGLLYFLNETIRWISERTYSVALRKNRSKTKSVSAYSLLGLVIVTGGYFIFIVPYPHPDFSYDDLALGVLYSLLYAELAAIGMVATIRSETNTKQVSNEIKEFLELKENFEQGPQNIEVEDPKKLVSLARSIEKSIRTEPASGTKGVADRLEIWADGFEKEDDFLGREEKINSREFSELADDLNTLQ